MYVVDEGVLVEDLTSSVDFFGGALYIFKYNTTGVFTSNFQT